MVVDDEGRSFVGYVLEADHLIAIPNESVRFPEDGNGVKSAIPVVLAFKGIFDFC